MNLHFITSISQDYWNNTAKYCIPSWNLPGKITVYIDQKEGNVEWFNEIPFERRLLHVPPLQLNSDDIDKNKVNKFWGKACAQLHAVYNNIDYDRIIWIDADVQQIKEVNEELFSFRFKSPLALLNTNHIPDSWETGLVIFNCQEEKIKVTMNRYKDAWHDDDLLKSLWKPYDAEVLGHVAKSRGYFNLCDSSCINAKAFEHSRFHPYFKHWINKTNKQLLSEQYNASSDIPQFDSK